MSLIGKVSAVFTANSAGMVVGVNQAAASMRRMQAQTSQLASGMRTLVAIQGTQFFAGIVSSAAGYVGQLVRMGAAQAEVIDQQSKLAARLGMTYGEFAGLALAGDLAGVGMDQIATAATKADVAFVKASQGSRTAQAMFANLGLSLEELLGMSAAERFQAIASAIAALPTEAQRSAAAVQLFGRAGAQLLPLFAGGAEGIAQAAEQAERLGLALTTAQGQDVEAMNDAFTLAQKAVSGVVQQVVAYLAPALQNVFDTFTNLVGSVGGANIGQTIGQGILQGARFLAGIGDYLIANFGSIFSYFSEVGGQWGTVMDFANRVAQVFYGAFKLFEFVGNTIGGLISDVVAFLLNGVAKAAALIPGFGSYAEGLRSMADSASAAADNYLTAAEGNLAAAGTAFATAFAETTEPVGQAMAGPLTTALDSAIAQAEASAGQIEEAGSGVAAGVGDQIAAAVATAVEPQAIKGIDSRSSEGVAEMFRLMRGGDSVQEQQLAVLETIAANTAGGEDDLAVEF